MFSLFVTIYWVLTFYLCIYNALYRIYWWLIEIVLDLMLCRSWEESLASFLRSNCSLVSTSKGSSKMFFCWVKKSSVRELYTWWRLSGFCNFRSRVFSPSFFCSSFMSGTGAIKETGSSWWRSAKLIFCLSWVKFICFYESEPLLGLIPKPDWSANGDLSSSAKIGS